MHRHVLRLGSTYKLVGGHCSCWGRLQSVGGGNGTVSGTVGVCGSTAAVQLQLGGENVGGIHMGLSVQSQRDISRLDMQWYLDIL